MGILKVIRKIKDPGSHGEKRSNQWPEVRKAHLEKFPTCAACGKDKKITVHHKSPFHLKPELELEPSNLITLCEGNKNIQCHIVVGHNNSYKDFNPDVEKDAKELFDKISKHGKK